MRVSRLAGLGLAVALTAGTAGAAVPANAATEGNFADNSSLAALTEWLKTHELQDWLNFLALTSPGQNNAESANGSSARKYTPPLTNSGRADETDASKAPAPTTNRSAAN